MPSWCYGRELFSQLYIPFWRQLQCQSGFRILHVMHAATQPKAYEYLSFQSESEDVVTKWLVFGHAVEGQGVVSYLLDVYMVIIVILS